MKDNVLFVHDCEKCEYKGSNDSFDFYTCEGALEKSYIARYGSNGPEYSSYTEDVLRSIISDLPEVPNEPIFTLKAIFQVESFDLSHNLLVRLINQELTELFKNKFEKYIGERNSSSTQAAIKSEIRAEVADWASAEMIPSYLVPFLLSSNFDSYRLDLSAEGREFLSNKAFAKRFYFYIKAKNNGSNKI